MINRIYKYVLLGAFMVISNVSSQEKLDLSLGNWGMDSNEMPYFSYKGVLPYKVAMKNGELAKISDDPYFLLGNYRFKLFVHVSGEYEIYSTDRVISHFNTKENSSASLTINNKKNSLTGIHSIAGDPDKTTRVFGAGYAAYQYKLDGVICKRVLSVLPSKKINEGTSGFRVSVSFKNSTNKNVDISYEESLNTLYEKIDNHPGPDNLAYNVVFQKVNENLATATPVVVSNTDPFPIIKRNDFSNHEYFPPQIFLKTVYEGEKNIEITDNKVVGVYKTTLLPGEQKSIDFIIGYTAFGDKKSIDTISRRLMASASIPDPDSPNNANDISKHWSKQVKHFSNEKDSDLRRELIWHNYVLESLASYNEYFDETFIPQGCMYYFSWGKRAAPRDQNQHALAACYTNPELAKSIIRYVLKKSSPNGNIPFLDVGTGRVTSNYYQTSDQQLFFFLLISEYLRITKDYDFLLEEVPYYPVKNAGSNTILTRIGEYYRYLREEVGTGPHGLIRLGNSDWNDLVFYRLDSKYNSIFMNNESHMNSTMAASILPNLASELMNAGQQRSFYNQKIYISKLTSSIMLFRDEVWNSYLRDHKDRTFSRRMYFNNKPVGDDNMFLEPQGFLMQIPEYGLERKKVLYSEIKNRILDSEKTGARQEEKMELSEKFFGSRENGGIWYSLNGPLIIGLSTWNEDAAWDLFHRLTLKNQSEQFPHYWSTYWSSFDATDSSILPSEGLHAQQRWDLSKTKLTYCSHIHAWLLYSYQYLKELE